MNDVPRVAEVAREAPMRVQTSHKSLDWSRDLRTADVASSGCHATARWGEVIVHGGTEDPVAARGLELRCRRMAEAAPLVALSPNC